MSNMFRMVGAVTVAALVLVGLGSADETESVVQGYSRWVARSGSGVLEVPLGWSKGLSSKFTPAIGNAQIDLATGRVKVRARELDSGTTYAVWLVDNRPGAPGHSVRPEKGDEMLNLGTLTHGKDGIAVLSARIGKNALRNFDVDLVVISESGRKNGQDALLCGSPTLYQRAHGAYLKNRTNRNEIDRSLRRLVREGERLFQKETFGGNGRTCATCHPSTNNFTIDPKFIAGLPPTDPLFVAEFVPALARNFEQPVLMRKYGLILENTNGFDNPDSNFTMRSVPHTLALPTSLEPATFDGTTLPPMQRTGWSGDGAPGGGSLREFAIGAVTQHFTRTLGRQPGVDFRLPTDEELDALEAFQLSLGRQQDLELDKLRLRSPRATAGLAVFQSTGKCFNCHMNAGANGAPGGTQNANFNTGVEAAGHEAILPADDGFARPGTGTFNTTPLVEAADTGPFFHNNSVATLEDAVAFYRTDSFNNSPSGIFLGGITMTDDEVRQVGALLRVINALENIRSATDYLLRTAGSAPGRRYLTECVAEIDDAVEVLQEGHLHPKACYELMRAKQLLTHSTRPGGSYINKAFKLLYQAKREIER